MGADVVVLSFVRSNAQSQIGFVADFRRLNVALTRAKLGLVALADVSTLERCRSKDLRAFAADARSRGVVFSEQQWRLRAEACDKQRACRLPLPVLNNLQG